MEIAVAEERVLFIKEHFTSEHAEGRAWSKRTDAFGALVKMTSLLQSKDEEDFQVVYQEHRYQPFWHVVCEAVYDYERKSVYELPLSSEAVQTVNIEGVKYPAHKGKLTLNGLEHCHEEYHEDIYVDGIDGERTPELSKYSEHAAIVVKTEDLEDYTAGGKILVPPQARASGIVREALAGMIKRVDADRVHQERVEVSTVDLYYRPVYAFQYRWISKEREGVMEFDAVTGELDAGGNTFKEHLGKVLDPEFLFDVSVDTVDLLVPGGGIAVKLARKGLQVARKRSKKS